MSVNSRAKLIVAGFRGSEAGVEGVRVVGAGAEAPVEAVETERAAAVIVRTVVGGRPWEARVKAC